MTSLRVRALVLAAGEGARLRPLTHQKPKPLLPVAGEPILAHTLSYLADGGCEAAAINLHHLGRQIRDHLGSHFGELPLVYSEERELLGTLGAVVPLHYVFEPADLMVVANGDSLCRWPVKKLIRAHRKHEPAATVLVSEKADPQRYGGGIGLDEEGRVVSFKKGTSYGESRRRLVFAGLHVFSPRLIEEVDQGPRDFVRDLYEPMIRDGLEIRAISTSRDWHDLGTPRRYLEGVLDWTRGRRARRLLGRRSQVSENAVVDEKAKIQGCAVEDGVEVAAGAVVENSLLLPGARVGESCEVRDAIVGFDVVLPPETFVQGRMINAQTAGFTAGPRDSLLGDLVYTPLDEG